MKSTNESLAVGSLESLGLKPDIGENELKQVLEASRRKGDELRTAYLMIQLSLIKQRETGGLPESRELQIQAIIIFADRLGFDHPVVQEHSAFCLLNA